MIENVNIEIEIKRLIDFENVLFDLSIFENYDIMQTKMVI